MIQAHKILNNKVIMSANGEHEFKIMVEQGYNERLNDLRIENKLLKDHLLFFQRDIASAINGSLNAIKELKEVQYDKELTRQYNKLVKRYAAELDDLENIEVPGQIH